MQIIRHIRLLSLCMAFMLLSGMLAFAEDTDVYTMEAKEITVTYNGKDIHFDDVHPETRNDRTMVPLRAATEQMGCEVSFDQGKISVLRDDKEIQLALGSKVVTVTDGDETKSYSMDVAPLVVNDRALVPIRFIAETFDCKVNWNASGKEAVIIDVAAWQKEMKEIAPAMDALLSLPNPGKISSTYQLNGTYTLKHHTKTSIPNKNASFAFTVTLRGKVFTSDGKTSANITLDFEQNRLATYINHTEDAALKRLLKQLQALKSMALDLLFDEEYNLYISGSGLSIIGNAFGIPVLENQPKTIRIPLGIYISDATGLPLSAMLHSENIWAGIEKAVDEDDHMFTRTVKAIDDFLASLSVSGKTTVKKSSNEQSYYWTMDDSRDSKTDTGNITNEYDVDETRNVRIRNGNLSRMEVRSTSKETTQKGDRNSLTIERKWNFQSVKLSANKPKILIPTNVIDWSELTGR